MMNELDEVEFRQSTALLVEIRELKSEIEGLDASIEQVRQKLKGLKADRKTAETALLELIDRKTPSPAKAPVLPMGGTGEDVDSPLSVLDISASIVRRLKTIGVERVPQLGRLIRGEHPDYPEGLSQVDGVKEPQARKVIDAYEQWKFGSKAAIKEELAPVVEKKKSTRSPASKAPADENVHESTHRARVTKEVDGLEMPIGTEIEGFVLEADNSFVTSSTVLQEGEYELLGELAAAE